MRPALVMERPPVVAPSWAAVERVLWLAAIDRCLRPSPGGDHLDVLATHIGLRRAILRHAPGLYEQTPIDRDREVVWIGRARDAIAAGSPTERAAVLVWAAVAAWTDAPSGRWDALADAGGALAEALDAAVLDGRHPGETARVATKLRAVMAETWREMEDGR